MNSNNGIPQKFKLGQELKAPKEVVESGQIKILSYGPSEQYRPDRYLGAAKHWVCGVIEILREPPYDKFSFLVAEDELVEWQKEPEKKPMQQQQSYPPVDMYGEPVIPKWKEPDEQK